MFDLVPFPYQDCFVLFECRFPDTLVRISILIDPVNLCMIYCIRIKIFILFIIGSHLVYVKTKMLKSKVTHAIKPYFLNEK